MEEINNKILKAAEDGVRNVEYKIDLEELLKDKDHKTVSNNAEMAIIVCSLFKQKRYVTGIDNEGVVTVRW